MFQIITHRWIYFLISLLIIIPGTLSLLFWGLRPGIDFTGGAVLEFSQVKDINVIKKTIETEKVSVVSTQSVGNGVWIVRIPTISQEKQKTLRERIKTADSQVQETRFESVGPTVGKETTKHAAMAVVVASSVIVLYIAWAFWQIPKPYSPWSFGLCAVVALLHDILLVVGVFSLLGHFLQVEIDSLFITALLTVMGFSIHDTIVVFDRIRENLRKMPTVPFAIVVNESIVQTMVRSVSTSLTVIFTLVALVLFGGESIRWFVVALLVGIISGTYSSIFTAAPLLVVWEKWRMKKVG